MKSFVFSVFAAALFALAGQSAAAMNSMHGSMMLPKCAAGDPVVGMNMLTKTYMTHDQMRSRTAGMSHARVHMMMRRNHIRLMCMSKAKAMGATMMSTRM